MERAGMAGHRAALLAGLTGEVVEIGAGSGANFRHYPTTVTRVLAVEPEPHLRKVAQEAARDAPVPVEVTDGLAEDLPVSDGGADAVVCTLVLCSIPDQAGALREIRRVLVPNGQFRFLEHVRADTPGMARVQRFIDTTFWPRIAGGCHLGRDTTSAVEQAGFTLVRTTHSSRGSQSGKVFWISECSTGRGRGDVVAGSGESMARPAWSRPIDAVVLVMRGRTARVAAPVAAVVGTVISIVNQAEVIVAGDTTGMTWVRIVVNYLVPYIVASVAYLSACRSTRQR